MSDVLRSRDCVVFFRGDAQTVVISDAMVAGGWPGGQGVQWAASLADERVVTYSNGLYGGFLVWGSDEDGDRSVATTRSQPHYHYATLFTGGSLISTSSYERYTWASRNAGPLVPLTYRVQDVLYFSLRGLWTKEDEMTLSGHSSAPASYTGFVAQAPKTNNRFFLGIQTSL